MIEPLHADCMEYMRGLGCSMQKQNPEQTTIFP